MNDVPSDRLPVRSERAHDAQAIVRRHANDRGQGAKTSEPLTLNFVLRALQQWWKVALPIGALLGGGAGLLAWTQFEPAYRASALLEISEPRPMLAFRTDGDAQRFAQTQIELLRSRFILEPIISDKSIGKIPELSQAVDPLLWIQRRLTVRNVGSSEFFEVAFVGPDGDDAVTIVNTIVDTFIRIVNKESSDQRLNFNQMLSQELDGWKRKVQYERDRVSTLAKQITGHDPFAPLNQRELAVAKSPLPLLQQKLIDVDVDHAMMSAEVNATEEMLANQNWEIPESELERLLEEHGQIVQSKGVIESLRSKLIQVKDHPKSPYTERYRKDLEREEQKLDGLRTELRASIRMQLEQAAKVQGQQFLLERQAKLTSLEKMKKRLDEHVQKMLTNQVKSTGDAAELEVAKGDLARAENVYDRIAERMLTIEMESKSPREVKIRDRAKKPRSPEEKSPLKIASLVGIAGFTLPFAIAIFWERRIKRILDSQQILEESYLPVVGEVAALPVRRVLSPRRGTRNLSRARYVFEESIDSLRTTLVLSDDLRDLQVLGVVSSVSREGKTSLSAQLAVSLARANNTPVLLVDADIRSPDLHQVFDVPLEPGLVRVLTGAVSPRDAVQRGTNELVHVLTAGRLQKSPHTLMAHGAFKAVLDQLRSEYRYIIVDTPPVLSASESLVVAKAVDGVLLCTLRETSRAPQVKLTYDRLLSAGASVIGVVLSGVPTSHYAHKYGSYAYNHR